MQILQLTDIYFKPFTNYFARVVTELVKKKQKRVKLREKRKRSQAIENEVRIQELLSQLSLF